MNNNEQSAQPCGCDPGCKPVPYYCERHREVAEAVYAERTRCMLIVRLYLHEAEHKPLEMLSVHADNITKAMQ